MIIALCGPAYAGKSEVGRLIVERLGGKHFVLPFAKPLKDMARSFGWDGKKDEKGRKFLQILGTEIGRCYNENFWVDQWLRAVKEVNGGLCDVVSDDTRYDNEAMAAISNGGLVVCVNADEEIRQRRAEAKGEKLPQKHSSESGLTIPVDLTLWNNDDLDLMRKGIESLVELGRARGIV
jgi:hypothetical protein